MIQARKKGEDRFHFERTEASASRVTIHAGQEEKEPISPRLFGNFFEHLGFSVQGGILAQLLLNPSFASDHNLPAADLAGLRKNGEIAETLHRLDEEDRLAYADWRPHLRVTGFGLLILDDETDSGIPLPWKVVPHGAAQGHQPGRIGQSIRLDLNGGAVRLCQGVFLPHHRQHAYEGYIWARASGSGRLNVTVRRRPGAEGDEIVVATPIEWPTSRWSKIPFTFNVPEGRLRLLEPVDFGIEAEGDHAIWIDQAVLLPSDHVSGLDPDMIELCRWLAPPVLRGPGGNFVSGYHFWHGIGPWDRRQTFPNRDWNGIDDNFFGTDEFLHLCELIDAEPHLCVNMGDGCAEEAANWVEYVNGDATTAWGAKRATNGRSEPYEVSLWEIGNEIYGPWQIGHCGAEENTLRYREWADAMRAIDPSIELIATGSCFDFVEPEHGWHRILLEEGGDTLESIALHALPNNDHLFSDRTPSDHVWYALMAHTTRWEQIDLPGLLALVEEVRPGANVDLSITEWGILGQTNKPQVGNLGGAIYAGLFLNMVMRCKEWIRVANATALFHGGCIRKAGPFRYFDPQVEVIQRYTQLAAGHLLPITLQGTAYDVTSGARTAPAVSDVPHLDAIAVRAENGEIHLVIVSRHAHTAVETAIEFADNGFSELISAEVMTADGSTKTNTPLAPREVCFVPTAAPTQDGNLLNIVVPPRSITWLRWR